MPLALEEVAFSLISVFEGLRLTSYLDAVGVWTIGYGHTKDVKLGDTCTVEQALEWFKDDSDALFKLVEGRSVQEGAALVSFGYNLGANALKKILVEGNMDKILLYDRAGSGHYKIPGLTARRTLEHTLIVLARGNK